MASNQSRRLAAVWFADIVGYTSLSAQNEDAALAVVDVLQRLTRELVAEHDGEVVKYVGDAVLVVFASVDAALRAALALQVEFSRDERVKQHDAALRVGCHLGEIAWGADGDVYGDGVNVASRIEGEAGPGQVVVTEAVQQQLKQRPDFTISDLGTRPLKGVQGPQRIFLVTLTPSDQGGPAHRDPTADHPTHIGPYRLVERLGEGGMGEVWLAEQTEPVERQVALKLIKLGMDTKQVLARFEAERQSLAMMDHRNIARIFDGGATHDGRPYFVMELAQGMPITEYCDSRGLSTRQRIGIFTQVCRAVQHAHQKGVVHRDLKPSNLLVQESAGGPFVKVIDFGIAKAMGQSGEPASPHTRMGQLVGTPEYMSPEQADPQNPDIDTRSDIYSLGIVLFELLVGSRPYDLSGAMDLAFASALREVEVPRPSTKLTTLDAAETVVEQRDTTVSELRRELRGDLDLIVLKALEADRARRYGTASEFATDLERALRDEPILARPPSKGYRLRKFVRRHRSGVAMSGIAVIALVLFGATMAVQTQRIRHERDRAERETRRALAVQAFMSTVLMSAEPIAGLGPEATVLEALDWIVEESEDGFSDDPEVDAAVGFAVGNVYNRLGRDDDAERELQRAYDTRVELLGGEHPDVAEVLYELAEVQISRAAFDSASVLLETVLSIRQLTLEADDSGIAFAFLRLAWSNLNLGELDTAEPQLTRALEIFRVRPEDSVSVSEPLNLLGELYRQRDELERAEEYIRDALDVRERFYPPEHTKIGESLNSLAMILDDRGEKEAAAEFYRRAITIQEAIYGPEADIVGSTLSNLGLVLTDLGQAEEGEAVHRRALAITEATLGVDNLAAGIHRNNLARHLCTFGNAAEGVSHSVAAVRIGDAVLDEGFFITGIFRSTQGYCLGAVGRFSRAEEVLVRSVDILEAALGPDSSHAVTARGRLAQMYEDWGKPELAAQIRSR